MKMVKSIKSIIIILSILVFMAVAFIISVNFFEPKAYNYMVQNFSAHKYGSEEIVIISIDEKSVNDAQRGIRWPWKRELYAKIFGYLNEYSMAKIVGFDAIIATPDIENPESDLKFYNSVKNFNNLIVGFVPLNSPYTSKSDGARYDKNFKNKFGIKVKDERIIKPLSTYQSLSKFPAAYFDSVHKVGSVVTSPDNDGYIRAIDQLVDYKGNLYPSLSLRMFAALHPHDEIIVKDNKILTKSKKLQIPATSYINGIYNNLYFYKNLPNTDYSHKTYSAIDIIESYNKLKRGEKPLISPQVFEDKIVLVGANAKATAIGLADSKKTPIMEDHPGVDIQATNLDNILHNEFLTRSTSMQDLITLLILLSATFLIVTHFSLFMSLGIIALLMISYIAICCICFYNAFAINIITPLLLQIVTMTIAYSYRFILEGRNKEKIQNAMGKYISQDVMQNVCKNIDDLKLGGKRANVTVLFADIRGFTSMSEKMSAEEVSLILNEYFTQIEPIINKYNGVINKFIGDAVMVIFGEPIHDKDHALNAVKCANEMLECVREFQKKLLEEGKPKIEIGIGINTGDAFVGNIGTESRLEYTVIGDMVNLASRIESYNKVYKTHFLISSTTYEKVRNLADVIKISEVSIRGKAKKLDIYEVLRLVD